MSFIVDSKNNEFSYSKDSCGARFDMKQVLGALGILMVALPLLQAFEIEVLHKQSILYFRVPTGLTVEHYLLTMPNSAG
ncbi:hypothetical protein SADUNF_Sadunf04G0057800 [Salix dunnii]|uniref:Uncharacterized protein n=1 Tax=Salix dunnii TaxID=1413687 RepID=A0A835K736_9ROSI|nr:hypothetical protein SADUNF_Sadunf04G0057800 [Salix dunnii]